MNLGDLLDLQVNQAMMTKAYNIHIGVSSPPVTVTVLVHIGSNAAENLQAATEWKSAILDHKKKVPKQQVTQLNDQLKKWRPVKVSNHTMPETCIGKSPLLHTLLDNLSFGIIVG